LARIANAGIAIAPTVVVPSSAFSDYLAGRWDDRLIFRTLELLQTESSLVVRASLTYDSVWCETGLHAGNSSVDLRNAIERIYRSFTTPRSRACRIACGWPEDEFNPTVVVQSDLPTVGRLLSRHAVTGRIVDADNWDDNVNNEMTVHDLDTYISLCHSAETALGSPVLTSFVESPGPSISDIEPPLMTDSALLTALLDLYQKGVLSSMSLLRRVQPSMFGYFTGRYKLDRTKRIGLISAIPAAPGQLIGIVRLRGFSRAELGNRTGRAPLPAVLVLDEATPDDVLDIDAASAAVGSIGGLSSHLAVMCRRMAKPCVVGSGIRVDGRNRSLVLPDGNRIAEGSTVAVDANSGVVEFSDSPSLIADDVIVSHIEETRTSVIEILLRETEHQRFRELSIRDQTHLAALKHRLREILALP
jgi:phosphoenolpyruvate synthase/pyruvate phosphate dikinase